jgi:hypothetical protein
MIIGLTGKARSGKDTAATMILEMLPAANKYAFADPLKEGLMAALGLTHEEVYGELKDTMNPLYGKTNREMLQTFGTDWARNMVNTDVWLLAAQRKMPKGIVVISDIRYDNEADFVRENGLLIHVSRNNRDAIDGVEGHASEVGVAVKKGDVQIDNNDTLQQLKYVLEGILAIETRHLTETFGDFKDV